MVAATLDNPHKRNALALDVMIELTETFQEVGATDALGVRDHVGDVREAVRGAGLGEDAT